MTIFEMLEKLETEIVFLRTRCQDLASALEYAQSNGTVQQLAAAPKPTPAVRKKKKKPPKRSAKRSQSKAPAPANAASQQQLELPVTGATRENEEQAGRSVGKRQALGKSLVQLRKMSAWRAASNSEHPPEEG